MLIPAVELQRRKEWSYLSLQSQSKVADHIGLLVWVQEVKKERLKATTGMNVTLTIKLAIPPAEKSN